MNAPFRILLRTPWRGPWREFRDPDEVIVARETTGVAAALRRVDDYVRGGFYAAGFVAYEAAGAYGFPIGNPAAVLPLVCFGIFRSTHVGRLHRLPAATEATIGEWTPSISHDAYLQAIAAIKTRIEAGDTYQVNFTFRLNARFEGDPWVLMRALYAAQRGGWSAFVETGDYALCSASPELFFAVDGTRVVCRPMKGTWPRGFWPEQDAARGEELRLSAKNRAENVMIVDMTRNDLGRLATAGSVRTTSLYDVERFPHQWQMTSDVEAKVERPSAERLFNAMFPAGSVTGAPKHRSMEIIRDLERGPRGIYTGAIGYLSPNRRGHFNVAIRTVAVDRAARRAEFGVGSGVVWDSVDRDEYDECVLKAEMLGAIHGARPRGAARVAVSPSYVTDDPPAFRLLESLLWSPAAGFSLLERHLERLRGSAACFGFPCDIEEVRRLLFDAVDDLRVDSKVRVLLEVDGDLLCEAVDLTPLPELLDVALAADPVVASSVFLYHKTTRREVYERARASRPDAAAVILWNEQGEVTEGTESNLVISRGDRRITPPLACGLLPGTLRAELLAEGAIVEERITKDELLRATDVWLINSVRGWLRARVRPE